MILESCTIWWRCVIPLCFHDVKFNGFLFIVKSGLFHIGERVNGATVEPLIGNIFHQAVRAEAMEIF